MRPVEIFSLILAIVLVSIHSISTAVVQETEEKLLNLLLLHNNDMHGRFEETSEISGACKKPGKCFGGFARTAHLIRKHRQLAEDGQGRKVLYLNAGDTYTGTSWFSVYKDKIVAEFLNILKPDVMCLGNHEFDLGVEGLVPFLEAVDFPIVSANLDFKEEPTIKKVLPSTILNVDGYQIGVIGHLTTDTTIIASTGKVIFNDVVESVRAETTKLDKAGVNIIIVLGHSGYEVDKQIAREVPLVDVVIGGHTNTFLWNGKQPSVETPVDQYPTIIVQKSGKNVPVVQAYAFTKYLGELNVTFNNQGDLVDFSGQPVLLDNTIPQDKDVLDVLNKYRPEIDALDKKVVGQTRVLLEAAAENKCRFVECNFGNLIADAFVFYMALFSSGKGWTDYPIALINGGSIRNSIAPGNITKGELLGVLPFESQILGITLNGSDLRETLELGVRSNGETSHGEFLQVSGLHVVYNMSKPVGSRVVSVSTRCGNCSIPIYEPLVPSKRYNIIITSFLANGGDGHVALHRNSGSRNVQDLLDVDMVEFYLKRRSPVYPEEQGRIQIYKNDDIVSASVSLQPSIFMIVLFTLFKLLN